MHFELVQRLRAPLEAVEAIYVDADFLAELGKLPELGHPDLLDQQDRGERLSQRVRYAFVGELSSAVRAVVDPELLSWVEESTLDRISHRTTFTIVPDHYGGLLQASGEISLAVEQVIGTEGGTAPLTVRRSTGDLRVHVPFVGHKVESAIISGLRDHAELEVAVVERWVAAHF